MKIQVTNTSQKVVVKIIGRFDFSRQGHFNLAYETVLRQAELKILEIEMSDIDFIDSSSLGMLLQLRESAQAKGMAVHLSKPSRTAAQALGVANFDRLFNIAW